MLLYQNSGKFYSDDDKKSALDSDISMEAFKKWTQFYTNYKFPLKADFPNRFRTGEMPIGIADYTTYNNVDGHGSGNQRAMGLYDGAGNSNAGRYCQS